ncbi:hypothetical protein [Natrarchaeobius chitinivorans]|uniref:Uncharacterized protein n=1 Tax=Natrarchaeobius chitinivorans TaxID=1679083 RepID=A0A3N6N7W5_NATCH|nr:hypothetical protein [Natrarchaeobius chitinivorans]RQG94482.1 hypothetical protein EA473_12105 [Natrarchaeobius chitinivorans]
MSNSSQLTSTLGIVLGAVLVALGVGAYVATDFASVTALIPAFFGVVIALLGVAGRQLDRDRIAVYGIGVLALLGILGSARVVPDAIALVADDAVDSVVATVSQSAMILICLVLLVAVVRDGLDLRRSP